MNRPHTDTPTTTGTADRDCIPSAPIARPRRRGIVASLLAVLGIEAAQAEVKQPGRGHGLPRHAGLKVRDGWILRGSDD